MPFARTDYRYKETTNIEMDLEELGCTILLTVLWSNITLLIACISNAWSFSLAIIRHKNTYLKHLCVFMLMCYKNIYLKHVCVLDTYFYA